MTHTKNNWSKYFSLRSKKIAAGVEVEPLSYGQEVYSSPKQVKSDARNGVGFVRWLVNKWKDEYNVFLEKSNLGNKNNKFIVESFDVKEKAIKFALEMCLICNGKLDRKKTIFD